MSTTQEHITENILQAEDGLDQYLSFMLADGEYGERTMGIVVDAVSEVHNIARDDLKPAPDFGGACSTESIKELATQDNKMLIMLDTDQLMNNGILQVIEQEHA